MFIDASAIAAVINQEAGWREIAERLVEVQGCCLVLAVRPVRSRLGLARTASTRAYGPAKAMASMIAIARKQVDEEVDELETREVDVSASAGDRMLDTAAT